MTQEDRKQAVNTVVARKIRVFCRIRPMSKAELGRGSSRVTERLDDYSVAVDTPRGLKEFQYDKVFGTTSSQEDVFQDVRRLIQSTIDGFNVCVFAYGQTGSGKTFTMVGDKELKNPGIMPRAFRAIFDIIQENASKFHFKVSTYMLELYNERLLDLFVFPADAVGKKIEIKKDKKGLVFAHGAETKEAASAEELFALFQQGCANRHVAATSMCRAGLHRDPVQWFGFITLVTVGTDVRSLRHTGL
ncbi:kinesin-like calmodulin-binding protein, partial [Arapaima gigas]